MKTIEYVIKDQLGIHARPAGLLVKEASKYSSSIIVKKEIKEADAKRIFALMSLGVKKEDKIIVSISGDDEDYAYEGILNFLETNL